MQKYRESFAVSELGRIYAQLPLKEMTKKIRSHFHKKHHIGNTPLFPPEGEVALTFLKSYTGQSDDGLIEMLWWQHPSADVLWGAHRSDQTHKPKS